MADVDPTVIIFFLASAVCTVYRTLKSDAEAVPAEGRAAVPVREAWFSPIPFWRGSGFLRAVFHIVNTFDALNATIMGVTYFDGKGRVRDTQIGITAFVGDREDPKRAVLREAEEELGLKLTFNQLIFVYAGNDCNGKEVWTFLVNLSETAPPDDILRCTGNLLPASHPYHVQLIPFGEHSQLCELMTKTSPTRPDANRIAARALIPVRATTDGKVLSVTTRYCGRVETHSGRLHDNEKKLG